MSPDYVYRGGQHDTPRPNKAGAAAGLVPLDRIQFHAHNVRRDLGDLRALADSIKQHGVVTPVVLERRGEMFRIRDGHRRVAAARLAGVKRVLAVVHTTALEDREWVVNSVQANHHRAQLRRQERGDVIERLRAEGMTWEEVAHEFGVTAGTVQRWALDTHADTPAERRPPSVIGRRKVADLIDELRTEAEHLTATAVLDRLADLVNGDTRP